MELKTILTTFTVPEGEVGPQSQQMEIGCQRAIYVTALNPNICWWGTNAPGPQYVTERWSHIL